ncbi:MAG TPA: hypothetical protein VIX86_06775 [Streptosporangiaceae bacterium]
MAGMVGLGRVCDAILSFSGVIFKFRHASAVSFYFTGDDTITITVGSSHATAATSPGNIITYFWTDSSNGARSAVWAKVTQAGANTVTTATDIGCWVTVFTSQIADPNNYIKAVLTNNDGANGNVAILHDLTVQRTPANLEIPNA